MTFYDLETHASINPDFVECAYNRKFTNKVDNYLKLRR